MVMVLVRWWWDDGGDGGVMMVMLSKIIKTRPSNTWGNFQNDWQTWWNDNQSMGEKHIETTQVLLNMRGREDKERSARPRKFNHERHTKQNLDEVLDIHGRIKKHYRKILWKQKHGKDKERLIQFRSTVTRVVTRRGPASSIEARIWQWREFVAWMDRWHNKRCHLAKVWWQPHSVCVEHQRDLFFGTVCPKPFGCSETMGRTMQIPACA